MISGVSDSKFYNTLQQERTILAILFSYCHKEKVKWEIKKNALMQLF